MSARKRRSYRPEYRRQAARLVIDTGRTIAEVAREIEVGEQLLGRWVARERARDEAPPEALDADERAELERLRIEVAELRMDREFLKKAAAFFVTENQTTVNCYRVMDAERAGFEITRMARLLAVSRSGYYAWKSREQAEPSPREQRRRALTAKIQAFHAASDEVYGAPRILADLREDGEVVSGKTVAKLMRGNGIVGISPRGFTPVTTLPGLGTTAMPDLVGRRFDQDELNKVWISDITYLPTGQGWLYLCVDAALSMAVVLRGTLPEKVIFHADRGTQYTSTQIAEVCAELGLLQSVGRTGVCWDNAPSESFWSTLKTEFYNRRPWPTKHEAATAVGRWLEERYNRLRRHSAIGMMTPVQFEQHHQTVNQAA